MLDRPEALIPKFDSLGYDVNEELATVLYLMLQLKKPLLLEGPPGVGKTEAAYILSKYLDTDLIRLQCYEGLDVHDAIYEWNYQKQLLAIQLQRDETIDIKEKEARIFGADYLMARPLLKAITAAKPVVLLIDEIDRADQEFEAFLLELLSGFQISIPEMGTIKALHRPYVLLTSNRTRELGDALKRRCLYHWINYPNLERETRILHKHIPNLEASLGAEIAAFVQRARDLKLDKAPGIAETIDWANGILALQIDNLQDHKLPSSLGCLVKSEKDLTLVQEELQNLLV